MNFDCRVWWYFILNLSFNMFLVDKKKKMQCFSFKLILSIIVNYDIN